MWFRNYRVAFSADIEAMYHEVQVNSGVAHLLRFLWFENFNSDEKPDTNQMLVHIFGGKIHVQVQIMQSEEKHRIMTANLMQQSLNVSIDLSTSMIF